MIGVSLFDCRLSVAEEPGINPSLLLCVVGCDQACVFCNARFNEPDSSLAPLTPESFPTYLDMASGVGARTVQITGGEPCLSAVQLLPLLAGSRSIPVVVNTSFLCPSKKSVELLKAADEVVGSVKFGNDDCARRLANLPDYCATVWDRVRDLAACGNRLVLRHLLMPGHVECCWASVAGRLARDVPWVPVSLLTGFVPPASAPAAPELLRCLSLSEVDRAVEIALEHGLKLTVSGSGLQIDSGLAPLPAETVELVIDPDGKICFHGFSPSCNKLVEDLIE